MREGSSSWQTLVHGILEFRPLEYKFFHLDTAFESSDCCTWIASFFSPPDLCILQVWPEPNLSPLRPTQMKWLLCGTDLLMCCSALLNTLRRSTCGEYVCVCLCRSLALSSYNLYMHSYCLYVPWEAKLQF